MSQLLNSIPLIDLDKPSYIDDIREACTSYGFFYVQNHRVKSLRDCFLESMKFFSLSPEIKKIYACNTVNLGYTSFQDETLGAPSIQSCGDTKEGYYIGREGEELFPNVWPSSDIEGLEQWKSVMLEYHNECSRLGFHLMSCISLALGLPNDYFQSYLHEPTALLRLLRYGRVLSDPQRGIFGAGEHSDYGFITLLATNEVSGLEICKDGTWIKVPPKPDCFVVNLGDCLQMLTNKKFRSTIHRVIIDRSDVDRYSIAFFYEPSRSAMIGVLPEYRNIDNDATIPYDEPITYGEYLSRKYEATHSDYKK